MNKIRTKIALIKEDLATKKLSVEDREYLLEKLEQLKEELEGREE